MQRTVERGAGMYLAVSTTKCKFKGFKGSLARNRAMSLFEVKCSFAVSSFG